MTRGSNPCRNDMKPKLTTQPEENAHECKEEFLEAIEREEGEKTQSDDHLGESRGEIVDVGS